MTMTTLFDIKEIIIKEKMSQNTPVRYIYFIDNVGTKHQISLHPHNDDAKNLEVKFVQEVWK